jgi:hypothetical protein
MKLREEIQTMRRFVPSVTCSTHVAQLEQNCVAAYVRLPDAAVALLRLERRE